MDSCTYVLTGKKPNGTELQISLIGERLSIGRKDSDILLEHDSVSRSHAVLERKNGGWLLSDVGSKNGTRVNGVGVARQMLVDGDRLSFGTFNIVYHVLDKNGTTTTMDMDTRVASDPGTCVYKASPITPSLIGRSPALQEAARLAVKAARSRTEPLIMIYGESGTGKELFARLVYDESRRRDKKFVIVNCAAFESNLVGDTLFGHVKGAFNDAYKDRIGVFEEADGGTVFLDEIGEINADVQTKLLRVLQEGTLQRLGSNETRKVDVRVICATNRNLRKMVAEGKFREDLFYRLNVISITLPPLRERTGDVEDLVLHFISLFGGGLVTISNAAMEKLCSYQWPGNVRELRNVMERTITLAESDEIQVSDLPPEILENDPSEPIPVPVPVPVSLEPEPEPDPLHKVECNHIQRVLDQCNGNMVKAAKILGMSRSTLYTKIKSCSITVTRPTNS